MFNDDAHLHEKLKNLFSFAFQVLMKDNLLEPVIDHLTSQIFSSFLKQKEIKISIFHKMDYILNLILKEIFSDGKNALMEKVDLLFKRQEYIDSWRK